MSEQKTPTMAAIARDLRAPWFRAELRSSWAIAVLYRVPSLPVTWACARLGLRPTAVTLLALVLALSMPVQAAQLPLWLAVWCVAVSGAVFQVLDCVDGTLARVTQRTSRRGGDMDFFVDMAQWGLLYLAIGLLADRTLGSAWVWTVTATGAAWLRLFARLIRDQLADVSIRAAVPAPMRPANLPVAFVEGLSGLIPFLALTGGWLWLSVLGLLLYALLDVAQALLPLLRFDSE